MHIDTRCLKRTWNAPHRLGVETQEIEHVPDCKCPVALQESSRLVTRAHNARGRINALKNATQNFDIVNSRDATMAELIGILDILIPE